MKNILQINRIDIEISEEDCEFLDSIYMPSKYPITSVLPYFKPDLEICNKGISIAESVLNFVQNVLK